MSVSLSKGGSVSLSKEAGGSKLLSVTVGLGWDPQGSSGAIFDLDASAIILGANGRALSDSDLVFYSNLVSPTGAVTHTGDNQTGEGDGDDEQLIVDLTTLPSAAASVVFIVSIDEAISRNQSFGVVSNAYIRVINNGDQRELAKFELTDGAASDIAMAFGELYLDAGEWKFRAIGAGYAGGLAEAVTAYGINVG